MITNQLLYQLSYTGLTYFNSNIYKEKHISGVCEIPTIFIAIFTFFHNLLPPVTVCSNLNFPNEAVIISKL